MNGTAGAQARRVTALLAVAAAVAAIGALTLFPHPGDPIEPGFFCVACGATGGVDFALNILLFVPFGMSMALLARRVGVVVLIALALSSCIETIQGLLIIGRDASLGDVIANSLGAFLGAWLTVHASELCFPTRVMARRNALIYAVAVTLLLALSGWVFTPLIPYQRFWVQWVPLKHGYELLHGRLDSLVLNGTSIRSAQLIDPSITPLTTAGGKLELQARAYVYAFPHGIAPIARLANPISEAASISMKGHAVLVRTSLRASIVRLRTPFVAVPCPRDTRELDAAETNPFAVTAREVLAAPQRIRAECVAGETAVHELTLRPALLWTLVWPREITLTPMERFITACWMAAFFLPLGFWRSRWLTGAGDTSGNAASSTEFARSDRRSSLAALGRAASIIMPLAVLVVPVVASGAPGVAVTDALGAVGGGVLGGVFSRLTLTTHR